MRADPSVDRYLLQVLADPGSVIARRDDLGPEQDEYESIPSWQARALAEAGLLDKTTVSNPEPVAE